MLTAFVLLVLYALVAALALTTRFGFVLVYAVMIMMVSNDFLLIPIMPSLSDSMQFVVRAWREMTIVVCLVAVLLQQVSGTIRVSRSVVLLLGIIAILSVLGFAVGLTAAPAGEVLTTWRNYFLPFLVPISLYLAGFFQKASLSSLAWTLLILSAVMSIYSLYATLTFNGDPRTVWFYYFFYDKSVEMNTGAHLVVYQFLRDGSLRASGFFISSVDYSMFSGIVVCFAIALSFYLSGWQRWLALGLGLISLLGIQLSHTRIGFVIVLLIVIVAILMRIIRMRYMGWLTTVPAGVLIISLAAVTIFPDLFDASAAGRPDQYIAAWQSFRPLGYGFILPVDNGPTFKDSMYLSVLGTFGVGAILFLGIFAYLQRALLSQLKTSTLPNQDFVVLMATYFALMSLWYVYGVHYTVGSFTENMVLLFTFAGLYHAREHATLRLEYRPVSDSGQVRIDRLTA